MAKQAAVTANHMTPQHYEGLGKIVNSVAEIDNLVDGIITMMIEADIQLLIPLLSMMNARTKREFVTSIAAESTMPACAIKDLQSFMKRIDKRQTMRNYAAHNGWAKGTREGSIKPFRMKVRGGLEYGGNRPGEEDYTVGDLATTAQQNHELRIELASFMDQSGLHPKNRKKAKRGHA